ncbi:serine hydrolase [Tissierella sp.]|uniref:serine hydrolase domain-containing protein n=1 Tax=Tissierella sp. TaxID=41274 RepID=UPI002854D451|nr:serine hydrolase [Tissierella sp.]MDR7855154.1 serine hydrolase [Tissierella sp.]
MEKYICEIFNGCISIQKEGKTIFSQAYGYADLANKVENQLDTRFATASAGKIFVAVGILQLIEKDLLHFTSTIGELVNIDWNSIDSNITVEQLLSHTSGIPDYFDESIMNDYDELWWDYPNYRIRSSSDLLPLFIEKPMMYHRGEKFQYNNTGFVVLGLIIEAVTGQSFDRYLNENVFHKCGMMETGYYELDRLPGGCANHYIWDKERQEYYTNIYSVDVKGTGAGGAYTCIGDIEKFWKALLNYELLSEKMTNKMLSIQASGSEDDNYGYGVWLNKESQENILPYFTGCDPGVSFITTYNRKENISITIMSNFGDDVWDMLRDISKEYFSV